MKFETQAIRTQTETTSQREHSTPIFPTSGYVFDSAEQMRALFAGEEEGNIYSRYTNPNCLEFEEKMKLLEKMPYAISSSSGMASIFSIFMGILKNGDHLISSKAVFGSTFQILDAFLPNYGIQSTFVDAFDEKTWEAAIRPTTKMFYIESPSNPGLEVYDLSVVKAFCLKHNLIFVIDNCFATPYLQTPASFGADIVCHSATKFIDGQGRVGGGITLCQEEEHFELIKKFQRQTGPTLSPFNAWILSKSLETLAVRMEKHCANALEIATALESHPELNWVKYPGLVSHPNYELAKKQMKLGGGLIAFEVKGGLERGRAFLDGISMCSVSANLGDTRSIITHPASTTHSKLSEEQRLDSGITQGMIRLSVGLEHPEDILADIYQSLEKSK
ncbi:MAG: O-succinylhomoserine sulfhydrylase [Flavobacteriaceae bacterium]|nr:MAG: O-succinylhomoserine sulfhydrylase [Flavobacteriaceae bacterium]